MDVRIKALRKTVGQLALIFIASTVLIYFSHNVSSETMLDIFLLAIIGIGSWMIYKANLIDCIQKEESTSLTFKDKEDTK